jgi:hypothetical protein
MSCGLLMMCGDKIPVRPSSSQTTTRACPCVNLGLWMRTLFGVGTPRTSRGRAVALGASIAALWALFDDAITPICSPRRDHARSDRLSFGFLVAASVP